MSETLELLIKNSPTDHNDVWQTAFPQARQLIVEDGFQSESDKNVFKNWINENVIPAFSKATDEVKESLRYCLEPRGRTELIMFSAGMNFICGFLPQYPSGMAPAVAALIVLTAFELRDRDVI